MCKNSENCCGKSGACGEVKAQRRLMLITGGGSTIGVEEFLKKGLEAVLAVSCDDEGSRCTTNKCVCAGRMAVIAYGTLMSELKARAS